jgi:alcohol dehydrogenase class IV
MKMGINGRYLEPELAVLDPDLTASCPHRVTAASGLDAIVHAIEAYMTCAGNPVAHATAVEALDHLFTAFPAAIGAAEAEGARLQMLLGAYLAGVTLRYSAGGVMGALSYPLGAEFGVPHGLAGGLLIPHVVRLNIAAGYEGYAALERRLGGDGGSEGFRRRVESLFAVIGAPRDFEGYAVTRAAIPGIVEQTHSQRAAVLAANPVRIDDAYLTEILEAVVPA